ncbi:MAG: hypothetical protein DMG15_19935 [Acidobacteria bacterium]|nr:MAG: hypothetical protein DMG15_19935 [Acidobacteriota bacterium]
MHLPQIGVKHEVGHHTSALALRVGLAFAPLILGWLRPIGLAFAPLIFLIAAPYRACIRSAHLFDRCALSGLHSLRSSF